MKKFLIDRLREPSTFRGLALLAAAFGIYIDPALVGQIGTGVVGAIGLYDAVRKG